MLIVRMTPLLAFWLGGCTSITDAPAGPRVVTLAVAKLPSAAVSAALAKVDADSAPFTYDFREPRPLIADPTTFVVATSPDASLREVQDAIRASGLTLGNVKPILQIPGHFEVSMGPEGGVTASRRIAAALRGSPAFAFAEPKYHLVGTNRWRLYLNRLVIQFVRNATSQEIDAFARDMMPSPL